MEPNNLQEETIPEDVHLKCRDCGEEFTYFGKDQIEFKKREYAAPVRCKSCRVKKKQKSLERQQEALNKGK